MKNLTKDDMQPEYDFSGSSRGKYARQLKEEGYTIRVFEPDGSYTETRVLGNKMIVLDDDVWAYFSTSESVNNALRTLINLVPEKHV